MTINCSRQLNGATPCDKFCGARICRPFCPPYEPPAVAAPLGDAAQDWPDNIGRGATSGKGDATGAARDAELIARLRSTERRPNCKVYESDCRHYCQCTAEDIEQAADRIAALAAERDEREEIWRIQQAGICTASLENTRESVKQRIGRDHPYWTPAYGDMCVTVDREIRERERAEKAEAEVARLTADAKPVAWAVISYLDDEITALEIEEPEMVVGYKRPLYDHPATHPAEATEEYQSLMQTTFVNVRCNACSRSLVAVNCADSTCDKNARACGLRPLLEAKIMLAASKKEMT